MNSKLEVVHESRDGLLKLDSDLFRQDFGDLDSDNVREDIKSFVTQANLFIGDTDDSDCKSPAKVVAFDPKNFIRYGPAYLEWFVGTIFHGMIKGKLAQSDRWYLFVEKFLSDPKRREELSQKFTKEYAKSMLFEGVVEFYQLLPHAIKTRITRNIPEIVNTFAEILNTDEMYTYIKNKEDVTKEVLRKYTPTTVIVKGDSEEDIGFTKACREFKIPYLGIYVSNKSPKMGVNGFHLYTPENHFPLVDFLGSPRHN